MSTYLLVAILLSAAALRISGIHAPPFDGDEEPVVSHALALSWQDWNPHVFFYGSFTFYLFKITAVIGSELYRMLGHQAPTSAQLYLLLRCVSALFGTATVFLTYMLGRLIGGRLTGLLAAGLMAYSPLALSLSSYATVDAVGGFWAALAWVGMALWTAGRFWWASSLAGLGVGAAMGTKYNAAVLLLPILLLALEFNPLDSAPSLTKLRRSLFAVFVVAGLAGCVFGLANRTSLLALAASWTITGQLQPSYIRLFDKLLLLTCIAVASGLAVVVGLLLHWRRASWIADALTSRLFLQPLAVALFTFVLVSPFVVLDPRTSVPDILYQVNKTVVGPSAALSAEARLQLEANGGIGPIDNRLYYVRAVSEEWGLPVFAAMLVGLVTLRQVRREMWVPLGVTVLLVLAMSAGWRMQAIRYLYPLWPVFSLLAAVGLTAIFEYSANGLKLLLASRDRAHP